MKADHKKSNETNVKRSALSRVENQGDDMEEGDEDGKFGGMEEEVNKICEEVHKQVRRRVHYLRQQKRKEDIMELGIPETHVEGVVRLMDVIEAKDSERDQENETGTKRVKLGKRANNSMSPSKEKRRADSPLRIESRAGMFSEVQDNITANITIVEKRLMKKARKHLQKGWTSAIRTRRGWTSLPLTMTQRLRSM